jgi:hypothetical protein
VKNSIWFYRKFSHRLTRRVFLIYANPLSYLACSGELRVISAYVRATSLPTECGMKIEVLEFNYHEYFSLFFTNLHYPL